MKIFLKAIDWEVIGFSFLHEKFPRISMEKLKAGVFDSPQIRELMKDPMSEEALTKVELSAWLSLKLVVTNFLGNHWCEKYKMEIEELRKSFHQFEALSVVTLRLFSKELRRFEWRTRWALSSRYSHYGIVLPRLVGCKLSHWLLLILEMGWGDCQAQEEVPEKSFHL